MERHLLLWAGLCLFGSVAMAELIPHVTAGQQKSQACVACHAVDGNSTVTAWPKIAGQPEKYLIEQLKEYKKGDKGARFNPVMYAITQALTDQDIVDLAAFFAQQKPTPGVTQQAWVELGQKIYRGGNPNSGVPACASCHSPKGEGNIPAGFPLLSGQHAEYMLGELKAFSGGTRSTDPNAIMREISKRLTDDEREAVSHYVSGLH